VTRSTMLLWSAASGLVVGLLAGVALLALLTLFVNVVPGLSERLIERLRGPVVLLLLLVVPVVGAVLGYLEGRAKLS
jgi:hypothetical protein